MSPEHGTGGHVGSSGDKDSQQISLWIQETLGFELVSHADQLEAIRRYVERRNLIVHNRGIIDRRYVRKLGTVDGKVGDLLRVDGNAIDAILTMDKAVAEADYRAVAKWGLPGRHKTPGAEAERSLT